MSLEAATRDARRAPVTLAWETNAVTSALFGGRLKGPASQAPLPSRELLSASDSQVPEVAVLRERTGRLSKAPIQLNSKTYKQS